MPLRLPVLAAAVLLAAPAALAQIDAERPGFAFAATVVGEGVFQVEAGLPEAQFGSADTYAVPVAVRVGLLPGVEVRAATSVLDVVRAGGQTDASVGFSVLTLGAKVAVPLRGVSFALIPEVLVPTEAGQDLAVQLNAPAAFDVGGFGVTLSPGIVAGNGSTTLNAVANVERAFGTLTPYAEIAAFPALGSGGGTPVVAGGGLMALLSPDVQVDAFFTVGVAGGAPGAGVGVGLSYRFD